MARITEALIFQILLPSSVGLDIFRLLLSGVNAGFLSAWSSWLNPTPLPDDCYLLPRVNSLLQSLYVLAVLVAVLSPLCTVAFASAIFRRETTYTMGILAIAVIMINIAVAAIVLALQTLIQPSLDMQTILKIRPDLSSEDVLSKWEYIMPPWVALAVFILSLVPGGIQIMAVSTRHFIPSPKRLPKQFQPFVLEKHKRKPVIGEPEASALGIELVAGVEPGPLARLFDDYEKRALISTHVDLESCDMDDSTRPRVNETLTTEEINSLRAFQEVNPLDRTADRPQFISSDRYWVIKKRGTLLKKKILFSTLYFVLAVSFETVRFARRSTQPDQWLRLLGVIYPWPLMKWIVAVLMLVHYRIALQRKVPGIIKLDTLLRTSFTISLLPMVVHTIASVANWNSSTIFLLWDIFNLCIIFFTYINFIIYI